MISIRCNRGCVLAGAKRGVVSTPAVAQRVKRQHERKRSGHVVTWQEAKAAGASERYTQPRTAK